MAAAAATPAVHSIVKDAEDVGVGVYNLYKAYKNQFQQSVDDARQNAEGLWGDMQTFEQAIQKKFDNQASLLALLSKGSVQICGGGLGALQLEIEKGLDSVMQSVQDDAAVRAARDFKTNLDKAMLVCNRISEDIVEAAESQQRLFTPRARRDIERAESSATELYVWAKSFVPSNPAAAMTKQSRLQMIPYIVAMAYAARIQAITLILERDMADQECDKLSYLKRARKVVDEFMEVLTRALNGVMADTSLLEIALDYQLPMAMYLTLMVSFRASVDGLLSPSAEHTDIAVWDDGLSLIREALRLENDRADSKGRTIHLDSIKDSMWWATFTDTDIDAVHASQLRISVDVRELCRMLGAENDERIDNFVLEPGHMAALLQLPPASTLRAALCAKITQARQAAQAACPPPPPPQSFARISATPPADTLRIAAAAYLRPAPVPRTLSGLTQVVYGVAVRVDSDRAISGSKDGTLRVWILSSGQHLRTLSGHTDEVNCVVVSPDGKTAVSGSEDKSMRVWNVDSESAQHTLQGHSEGVWAVALSPDGRSIASGSWDKTVRLWNADSEECQATLEGHSDHVYCVAFSPDGESIVSGSRDKSIRVWSVRTREIVRTLIGHSSTVLGVAVMPDGRRLVSSSDDCTVRVWNVSSGAQEMRFEGHTGTVRCVAVFPDGERIASGSWDKSVRVWNVRSKALELTLTGHTDKVRCICVAADGQSVVSGGDDKTIKVWALSRGEGAAR